MHPVTRAISGATSFIVLVFTASLTVAEPAPLRANGTGWEMNVAWWLFAPIRTTGTSTIEGQSSDIDMSLSDALEVLDFTSSLRFEAWNGRLGILADANFLKLSEDGGATIGSGPFARDLDVEVDAEQYWITLMGGYKIAEGVNASGRPFVFDLHGGLRYNRIRQDVEIEGPVRGGSPGGTETWWEPVIGVRGLVGLNDAWSFSAVADFGGFGAGGNDLAWSANAAFDRKLSERASLKVGYRYYSIDFETGGGADRFGWDLEQHGPFIGLAFSLN
ncbi:MAG: hypothetical protein AAGG56_17470 [Pseudomonadota bacterium]